MRFILILIFCAIGLSGLSQDKLKFGNTNTTSLDPTYKAPTKNPKNKRPIEWIKNSSKGLLLGNPCMEAVHQEFGFIYIIQLKGRPGSVNGFDRFWHNLAAKTRIMFKKGPFWKFKLKKRRKECRGLTGDYVG